MKLLLLKQPEQETGRVVVGERQSLLTTTACCLRFDVYGRAALRI